MVAISDESHLLSHLQLYFLSKFIWSVFIVSCIFFISSVIGKFKSINYFQPFVYYFTMSDGLFLWNSCFLGSADFVSMGSVSVCLLQDVHIILRLVYSSAVHYQFNYLVFNIFMIGGFIRDNCASHFLPISYLSIIIIWQNLISLNS